MLVGRARERARIGRFLESARTGNGGGLLVLGEPGIGKTALLDDAAAESTGFRILRATGVEAESELTLSGLFELLQPLAGRIENLPPRQAAALRAAFAEEPLADLDGFAVAAATLGLLAEAAADEPVLCLVDDVHWLDAASAAALAFTVRRIEAERIGVVVAARVSEVMESSLRRLPILEVESLDSQAATELIAAQVGGAEVPEAVTASLLAVSGGNPLVLHELVGSLQPSELTGALPLPDPLPVGTAITEAYARELGELPTNTRTALLVLALSEPGPGDLILPAIAALTGDAASLDPAERARLVRSTSSGLSFRHPLLRSVIHDSATTADRRAAHEAIARALPAADVERRAWHRALAAVGPDEATAAELAHAARLARHRGGRYAESRAFELAARLSPDQERRAQRTYAAGAAAFLAGQHRRAAEHMDRVLALSEDPLLRADAEHERARIALWRGRADPPERLQAAAERVAPYDSERAAKLVAYAIVGLGGDCRAAAALPYAERAWELIGHRTEPLVVAFKVAYALVMAGETLRGEQLTMGAAARADRVDDATALSMLGPVLGWLDRSDEADRVLARAIDLCRASGDLWMLVNALTNGAEAARRRGRFDQGLAWAAEARDLAQQLDEPLQGGMALAVLARLEAELGRAVECQAHARLARRTVEDRTGATDEIHVICAAAHGSLALASGRYQDAIGHFTPAANVLRDGGVEEPRVFALEGDLAEAYVRAGRHDDALKFIAALEARATACGARSVLAQTARCRGLLAVDDGFLDRFEQALGVHRELGNPIEQARTLLCLGERLRRQGKRSAARNPLRTALATFVERGAVLWADRARSELLATGETVQPRTDDPRRQLTPQELQIALLVASGARNRDIAVTLFLSPKTVEAHLTRVYRKLAVRSRTELAARLRQGQR